MEKLKYDPVTKENRNIAFSIQKTLWPDDPDYYYFVEKSENNKVDNVAFLVRLGKEYIGITGVEVDDDPESIWLGWFGILEPFRRNGYGKQILLDTIEYCRRLNKYEYFRLDTTYWKNRPALYLYDEVMTFKESYTKEDSENIKHNYLIYTYSFHGKKKLWNNRYLGLNTYYEKCKEKTPKF